MTFLKIFQNQGKPLTIKIGEFRAKKKGPTRPLIKENQLIMLLKPKSRDTTPNFWETIVIMISHIQSQAADQKLFCVDFLRLILFRELFHILKVSVNITLPVRKRTKKEDLHPLFSILNNQFQLSIRLIA